MNSGAGDGGSVGGGGGGGGDGGSVGGGDSGGGGGGDTACGLQFKSRTWAQITFTKLFYSACDKKRPQSGLSDKANCTSSHEPHPSEKRPVANDALTEKSASETSPLRRQKCVSRLCALHAQF